MDAENHMDAEIQTPADAAFALLGLHHEGALFLTRKAGQFLGQLVTAGESLSDGQAKWLSQLMDKAGLPNFQGGE